MAPFPDSLPPEGLDSVYKLLIYYGIVYVLTTALTTWFITRRRSFPQPQIIETTEPEPEAVINAVNLTGLLTFDSEPDRLASLIVEEQGIESALSQLHGLREQISQEAFQSMNISYNDRLAEIKTAINEIQNDMTQEIATADVPEPGVDSLDEDLEKQLMDLENDDFLKPRKKRKMDEIFEEPPSSSPPKSAPPQTTPPATTVSPPVKPKSTPLPPPPSKPDTKKETTPASIPAPSSKKVAPPPPPGKGTDTPKPQPPKAVSPSSSQPLSAAQPMKVQSEQDDTMFAKSTSIAALRMDMLRELARLKKLIPEDQEKE